MAKCTQYFKYALLLVILALVVPLVAACGGSEQGNSGNGGNGGSSNGPFTIGVSNGFVASEWRTQMIQDMQGVNAEYKKAGLTKDLVVQSADVDVNGQIQQIRNLINRGVNAIIIDPNSPTGLDSVIKQAKDAGITVICVDEAVSSPEAINVVIDQTEWARMSARWLAEQLHGKGNVVVVNGVAGHPANEARYDGVKEVFKQYPGIKVLNVVNANWDEATGQQKMADLLASQPNIDGIWVQDGMAQGVLQAVDAANPAKWPVIVGEARAGYLQLWQKVKQKHPDFTSYGVVNPPGAGASGLRVALELLQGKKFKDGTLKGDAHNTLFVPIPGKVDASNFEQQYAQVKDKPGTYTLDGSISEADAKAFFQ
ncbi:ABC transporter substrate-binding protein [Ktedonosporobacter rubrisoli]|uniref:ABC transporter substrate-binding protein n=1 Tax=Ktedonosporobacter rubrisoli TaxID=2509675 RepID=UPI001A90D072|nr:ABC transporter substrate-binding protein [Ktedonosporobacter rubrisoli]